MADYRVKTAAYAAPGQDSTYLLPVYSDTPFRIEYGGASWHSEESSDALEAFSRACAGFFVALDTDALPALCSFFAKSSCGLEPIRVIFDRELEEPIFCGFALGGVIVSNDLKLPEGTGELTLFEMGGCLHVETFTYHTDVVVPHADPIPVPAPDPIPAPPPKTCHVSLLKPEIPPAPKNHMETLHRLQEENQRLRAENAQLQDRLQSSPTVSRADGDEIRRLSKVVTQLADQELSQPVIETANQKLNELIRKVNEQRDMAQKKRNSCAQLEEELRQLNADVDSNRTEIQSLLEQIQKAEEVMEELQQDKTAQEEQLQRQLDMLGMDRTALQLYSNETGVKELEEQINVLIAKTEEMLKKVIQQRQLQINHRFGNVTT